MSLKFGTDGVRGRAFVDLRPEWVTNLAISASDVLQSDTVVIGSDGRESGKDFVSALRTGFESEGLSVWYMGTVPTPALAHAAATHGIAGAMVSASHNPSEDNGIKLLSAGGKKLNDDAQSEIEAILESNDFPNLTQGASYVEPSYSHLANDWVSTLRESIKDRNLSGISLVVDCANGAVSAFAANTLRELGAKVVSIHDAPDGTNINEGCGSTSLGSLRAAVRDNSADLGLAFDGDADRVLAIDRQGRVIDGDFMIAICAEDMKSRKALKDNTAVVTVMTNLGFHLAMKEKGIHVHQTPVGDRQVLAALVANDWSLGGEQSGHIIFSDLSTTGDGLLTGIQLLDIIARSNKRLDELADFAMIRYPQVLKQVNLSKTTIDIESSLAEDIANAEIELGDSGRVLVRRSGTEPVLRIMVESLTDEIAESTANKLVLAAESYLTAS
ncbi:MAG: phosphoglucosamine mutase [Acidimicrobiaceae bacterium]|jgi:phosphoglucosamine mutase|nr:phosphoglucosamine mutase [Acidimicrobiaceae bacterium]|tara:strand:- start:1412 stop:2740 length:1329 start_codon:yes stop_codon:yes gene_type:complete